MTNTTAAPTTVDLRIVAEHAPIGVQVWPTRTPAQAPNFTIADVEVTTRTSRSAAGTTTRTVVTWTYENGTTREFEAGAEVACRIAADQLDDVQRQIEQAQA